MASSEKEMITLEDIRLTYEGLPDIQRFGRCQASLKTSTKSCDLCGVIAVLIVVAVAASLIGKYLPTCLSKANLMRQFSTLACSAMTTFIYETDHSVVYMQQLDQVSSQH